VFCGNRHARSNAQPVEHRGGQREDCPALPCEVDPAAASRTSASPVAGQRRQDCDDAVVASNVGRPDRDSRPQGWREGELLADMEGASSRPVRLIVLREGRRAVCSV
jgi:hypothetical protein